MEYELIEVKSDIDWHYYHNIRKSVLFEARGRVFVYDENHPDEYLEHNHSLLFKYRDEAVGTCRLDNLNNKKAIVRLVAIIKEKQRKGHGRILNKMVEEYARTLGVCQLYVNAAPEAIGFYECLGYRPYSWNPSELTGFAENCLQMKKDINS